jgi:hypothetical protein
MMTASSERQQARDKVSTSSPGNGLGLKDLAAHHKVTFRSLDDGRRGEASRIPPRRPSLYETAAWLSMARDSQEQQNTVKSS